MSEPSTIPTIEGYRILRLLGQGGVGSVYLAEPTFAGAPKEQVAIKVVPTENDPTLLKRFEQEARLGETLDHPDIIKVQRCGTNAEHAWIAMEYLDGFEFSAALQDPEFGLEDRLQVLIRIAMALHYAHEHSVIHRDVKPSNIFLTREGGVRLLDFGIARLSAQKLTKTGYIVGTPHFMSPEQIAGVTVNARADGFSLGVVAYLALTGALPWSGENHTQIMMAICSAPAIPLSSAWDDAHLEVPKSWRGALEKIVHKAISQEPKRRYDSCLAFATAIETALQRGRQNLPMEGSATAALSTSPEVWVQRKVDWALARAAKVKLQSESLSGQPTPLSARAPISQPQSSDAPSSGAGLWIALLGLFAVALGVVIFLLTQT